MRRDFTLALIAIALAGAPASLSAQDAFGTDTGNELLVTCESTSTASNAYCIGFIKGVLVTERGLARLPNAPFTAPCIPEGVTMGQLKDIVVAYLKERPQERHWQGWSLVHNAANNAFPCSRSEG